jgi:hypothetical protein
MMMALPAVLPTMALLLALLLLNGAAAAPPTAPGDVKALCDLYFGNGGANWFYNTGFTTCNPNGTASSDPCGDPGWKWPDPTYGHLGVTQCDTSGQSSRVTGL